MKIAALYLLAFPVVALPTLAGAAALPPRGAFLYSNACESGGGDWAGFLVQLTRGRQGMKISIEFNDEGPDSGPVAGTNVSFDPVSGKLQFTYVGGESNSHHQFVGDVSVAHLSGRFDNEVASLPAIRKKPKTLPECH